MFREYFINGEIYSLDINLNISKLEDFNIKTLVVDLNDEYSFKNKIAEWNIKFDVVIEDASHYPKQQIRTMFNLLPYLNPCSIYIIEDVPYTLESIAEYFYELLSKEENLLLLNRIREDYIVQTNKFSKLLYFVVK